MKVRFIKYHPLFAYDVGDEGVLLEKDALYLLNEGYAEAIQEEAETADLPKKETATIKTKKK